MANELKEYRRRLDLRQQELAGLARVATSTICGIERYDVPVGKTTKARLASALGVSVERLWPPEPQPSEPSTQGAEPAEGD